MLDWVVQEHHPLIILIQVLRMVKIPQLHFLHMLVKMFLLTEDSVDIHTKMVIQDIYPNMVRVVVHQLPLDLRSVVLLLQPGKVIWVELLLHKQVKMVIMVVVVVVPAR